MSAPKLTDAHVEAILYHTVLGRGPTEIAGELAAGIAGRSGESLAAVDVAESTVRYHVGNNERRVEEIRHDLYGGAYTNPLAHPGERLRRLEQLWKRGMEELERLETDESSSPLDRHRVRKELAAVVSEAGAVMQDVDPDLTISKKLGGGVKASAKGRASPEVLQRVARKLKTALEAGAIDLGTVPLPNGGPTDDE